jgi:hypothetical protein
VSRQKLDPQFDQKWTWPRKTWFQERLNLVRAREREMNRKATVTAKGQEGAETKPEGPTVIASAANRKA